MNGWMPMSPWGSYIKSLTFEEKDHYDENPPKNAK